MEREEHQTEGDDAVGVCCLIAVKKLKADFGTRREQKRELEMCHEKKKDEYAQTFKVYKSQR